MSARIGSGREFVVEADEYDTAFFDKRSKFVHYRPLVAILNNLEYDHADIFPDVAAIQRQFHHLVRTVPRRGRLIVNGEDAHLAEVLAMGCWTPVETFGLDASLLPQSRSRGHGDRADERAAASASFDWTARLIDEDGSAFAVVHDGVEIGEVRWPLLGRHNVMNALAALAAAHAVGVDVADRAAGAGAVPQRQASPGSASARPRGVTVYDDFAHHPTAIATTLAGLRAKVGDARGSWWRWSRAAIRCAWARMPMRWRRRSTAPTRWCSCIGRNWPGMPARWSPALRGEGVAVADVDALIAALREHVRATATTSCSCPTVASTARRAASSRRCNEAERRRDRPSHRRRSLYTGRDAGRRHRRPSPWACSRCTPCCCPAPRSACACSSRATSTWSATAARNGKGFGVCLILRGRGSRRAGDRGRVRHRGA